MHIQYHEGAGSQVFGEGLRQRTRQLQVAPAHLGVNLHRQAACCTAVLSSAYDLTVLHISSAALQGSRGPALRQQSTVAHCTERAPQTFKLSWNSAVILCKLTLPTRALHVLCDTKLTANCLGNGVQVGGHGAAHLAQYWTQHTNNDHTRTVWTTVVTVVWLTVVVLSPGRRKLVYLKHGTNPAKNGESRGQAAQRTWRSTGRGASWAARAGCRPSAPRSTGSQCPTHCRWRASPPCTVLRLPHRAQML